MTKKQKKSVEEVKEESVPATEPAELDFVEEEKTDPSLDYSKLNIPTLAEIPIKLMEDDAEKDLSPKMHKTKVVHKEEVQKTFSSSEEEFNESCKLVEEAHNNTPVFKFLALGTERVQTSDGVFVNKMPKKGTLKATGWDVHANTDRSIFLKPFEKARIPLGLKVICPEGWWLELRPRSSTFAKKSLHSLYGVIDEDYTGELLFCVQYIPERTLDGTESLLEINPGDSIGQLVPVRRQDMGVVEISEKEFEELEKLKNTRGNKGFGSTG